MTDVRRCEMIRLEQVYELSFRLFQEIRSASYSPDLVVAIARGGYVPARLLCDFLGCRDLSSLGIRHYEPGARRSAAAEVIDPLGVEVRGRRVLVVDDVNDTGDTIVTAREHLDECGAADVRVAVLHEKQHSPVRADFRAAGIGDARWLIYQWAVVEDALGFLDQLAPAPQNADESRTRLEEEFGFRLDDMLWEKVMGARSLPAEPIRRQG